MYFVFHSTFTLQHNVFCIHYQIITLVCTIMVLLKLIFMSITVAFIDHLKILRKSYPLPLQQHLDIQFVLDAENISEFKQKIALLPNPPNVILIDMQLVKNNSIALTFWLTEFYPNPNLIAISLETRYAKIHAIFSEGCVAFFGPSLNPDNLYQGICDVNNECFKSNVPDFMDKTSFMIARSFNGQPIIHFSYLELDYLELFCTALVVLK